MSSFVNSIVNDLAYRPCCNEVKEDLVNHPAHYKSETGLEAIDVIEAFTFDLKGVEAFDAGNALKYLCRWKSKNGLQDLKKAKWYLEHLINHVEKLEKENDEETNNEEMNVEETNTIDCPKCGKTLNCLYPSAYDNDNINEFWCEDCDLDITIEDVGTN